MAQAMAAAAAHSMPPFPLPALPRVRPPPIPKGTPGLNTLPMPKEPPSDSRLVWVDGKWVPPSYSAAKHRRKIVSKQLEKALQHEVHGMNIYAYRHLMTNQVVYSLTKNMDNDKIMKQLLFHGKKTVPSAIRRDMWRPHFSVHFPKTANGATKGLKVFKDLRELTLRRQLDPPRAIQTASAAFLERFKKRRGTNLRILTNRATRQKGSEFRRHVFPVPGQPVNQMTLARRLMNQRATSVADLAAVLTRMTSLETQKNRSTKKKDSSKLIEGDADTQAIVEDTTSIEEPVTKEESSDGVLVSLSARASKRIKTIRQGELAKTEEIDARKLYLQDMPGQVKIDRHTLERLSTEYDGSIGSPGLYPTTLALIDAKNRADEATQALSKALQEIKAQKESKRQEIESRESTRIDRELAAKSEEERQQIETTMKTEKERVTGIIGAEVMKTREMLRQYKALARTYNQNHGDGQQTLTREQQTFIRETTQHLLDRKAYLNQRYATWYGPYAQVTARVDEAMVEIDTAHEERLAQLALDLKNELKDISENHAYSAVVRWADRRDGLYAESWPENVFHEEVEAKAVVLSKALVVRQHAYLDENEDMVDEQKVVVSLPHSNSVHVFGAELGDKRYQTPEELQTIMTEARERRITEHLQTSNIQARDKIITLQILQDDLMDELDGILNVDLRNALKAEVNHYTNSLTEDLEAFVNEPHAYDAEYQQEYVSWHERHVVTELETKLTKITSEGDILDDSSSVVDTDTSARAKELALQILDARVESAVFRYRHRFVATELVEPYEKFAILFRERAAMSLRYPAAEEWLAQETSVISDTSTAPDGVAQIQAFESQYKFIGDAMKRQRLNSNSTVDLIPVETYTQKLEVMTKQILTLRARLAKAVSDDPNFKDTKNLEASIRNVREDRIKLIQANNIAFDKQAWREHRETENNLVRSMLAAREEEERSRRTAQEEEEEVRQEAEQEPSRHKPATFLGRVKGFFSR